MPVLVLAPAGGLFGKAVAEAAQARPWWPWLLAALVWLLLSGAIAAVISTAVTHHAVSHHAVSHHAVPDHAVSDHAVPDHAVPDHAVSDHDVEHR
ncbi:hypothetical protein EV651_11594 [Kribbella sp. VKM Ac-2571]|nr:hypothetical protein EV651_11594 [Kribbella sp. VKM Ac-2571]